MIISMYFQPSSNYQHTVHSILSIYLTMVKNGRYNINSTLLKHKESCIVTVGLHFPFTSCFNQDCQYVITQQKILQQ